MGSELRSSGHGSGHGFGGLATVLAIDELQTSSTYRLAGGRGVIVDGARRLISDWGGGDRPARSLPTWSAALSPRMPPQPRRADDRVGERLSEYRCRLPGLRHFRDGSRFRSV